MKPFRYISFVLKVVFIVMIHVHSMYAILTRLALRGLRESYCIWRESSVKPFVAPEEYACTLIYCLW